MSAAIYILDQSFNLLIHRQYREDLNTGYIIDCFKKAHAQSHPIDSPVLQFKNITFIYLKYDEIILLSPVCGDIDVMTQMMFLSKFSELLKKYFRHYKLLDNDAKVTSDLIKDSYILIYELFDECFDFGIPQLTDFSILKDYIKLMIKPEFYHDSSHLNDELNDLEKQMEAEVNSSITRTSMNKISWRPKGIFYNKNEFFINFNEFLKFKYNSKINKIVSNQIFGEIKCKSYLSGMPHLKLGINETLNREKSIISKTKYHQCVDLTLLDENTIEFIPPDGEFSLLSYQILNTQILQPLILIKPHYRIYEKGNKLKLRVKIEMVTTFKRKFFMDDVKIRIPLIVKHSLLFIDFNQMMKFKTKLGNVIHSLDDECIIWNIEKIQGSMRGEMLAEFDLLTEKELFETHLSNYERGRQERNDLFYFDLTTEFQKLGLKKPTVDKIENILQERKDTRQVEREKYVTVEFQLQNMLYSGIKVDFLTIKEDQIKSQTFPWIMYSVVCKGDDYCFTLSPESFVEELSEDVQRDISHAGSWKKVQGTVDDSAICEIENTTQPKEDFSTALDHEQPHFDRSKLGFEEYIVENEEPQV